jgi:hypothetical protein
LNSSVLLQALTSICSYTYVALALLHEAQVSAGYFYSVNLLIQILIFLDIHNLQISVYVHMCSKTHTVISIFQCEQVANQPVSTDNSL